MSGDAEQDYFSDGIRIIVLVPQTDFSRALLASALEHLGESDEARQVWRDLREINPNYSLCRAEGPSGGKCHEDYVCPYHSGYPGGGQAALAQTTGQPNNGAGVPGLPGNKSGPTVKPGQNANERALARTKAKFLDCRATNPGPAQQPPNQGGW